MKFLAISVFIFSLFTQVSFAKETFFCGDYLESMPIQQGGRVKPLYVHSKEILKYVSGKSSYGDYSSTVTFCLLNFQNVMGLKNPIKLETNVDHVELKKLLNFKEGQKRIALDDIEQFEEELRIAQVKNNEETSFGKAIRNLNTRKRIYQDIVAGVNWAIPEANGATINWVPVSSFLTEQKVLEEKAKGNLDPFKSLFLESQKNYEKIEGTKHLVELRFAKMRLTTVALLMTIIALAFLIGIKNTLPGIVFSILTVLLQTAYISFRVYISGRAPITNMYETVLFSGYGGLILALIICAYRKEKIFMLVGLGYNVLTLMMLHFSGGMLNSAISPLVPVLRDNFWLSTHVTTVILSYGAYALSWVLANYILIKNKFSPVSNKYLNYYVDLMYTCLKYGCIMLAAGLLLGGVWADYSWGRFWGWDPKETWSLIVLCFYMAVLHGKYTSWITNRLFVPLTALCFLSVMMAWFGVNYILASGLHSYGFSEGGALFLGTFFLIQIAIVATFGMPFFKLNTKKNVVETTDPSAV